MTEISGTDLSVAMNRARLNLTDMSRLAGVSRPTLYSWRDAAHLPPKAAALVMKLEEAIQAGRLPLKDVVPPVERPRIARIAVYGE